MPIETDSLSDSDIHMKWVHWTCLRRLDHISRAVDHTYKQGDEWEINEEAFRRGMRVELVSHTHL